MSQRFVTKKTTRIHLDAEDVLALGQSGQGGTSRHAVEAKLLEAVERGDYREVTPEFWQRIEAAATNALEHAADIA